MSQLRHTRNVQNHGRHIDMFKVVREKFKKQSFQHIRLENWDDKNLRLFFVVSHDIIYQQKKLKQIYIDGTFKTKFAGGQSYNVLAFATNLKGNCQILQIFNINDNRFNEDNSTCFLHFFQRNCKSI